MRSHSGDRFSLVAFLHPLLSPSAVPPPDVQANLIKAGFKPGVVDLPSRVPPTRVQISAEVAGKPGVVYIGRGHSGLGLPRSPWANPFKVTAGVPRKKVIKDFKRHLERAQHLLDDLGLLAGKVLACHCPLHLPCHGDVIIQAFRDRFCVSSAKPPKDSEVEDAIEVRSKEAAGTGSGTRGRSGGSPTVQAGLGDPIMVRNNGKERLLVDGGGLCSPGFGLLGADLRHPPWPSRSGSS